MNYTHEEVLKALTLIHEICDDTVCDDCPFSTQGDCVIQDTSPNEWKVANNDGRWRAFL